MIQPSVPLPWLQSRLSGMILQNTILDHLSKDLWKWSSGTGVSSNPPGDSHVQPGARQKTSTDLIQSPKGTRRVTHSLFLLSPLNFSEQPQRWENNFQNVQFYLNTFFSCQKQLWMSLREEYARSDPRSDDLCREDITGICRHPSTYKFLGNTVQPATLYQWALIQWITWVWPYEIVWKHLLSYSQVHIAFP